MLEQNLRNHCTVLRVDHEGSRRHRVLYWLFSYTPTGATASAQIYSLVETAKVNDQVPYTWLRHVPERLPQAQSVEDFETLLPWNCSPEMPR